MITFRYKYNTKQIKVKTKRRLEERMSPWLQGVFSIRNPIVGFRVASNKYYDSESFYLSIDRFYNQIVDIIEANDMLQISFVSDNLNSSSNIRVPAQLPFGEDLNEDQEEPYRVVTDAKEVLRRVHDKNELSILFSILAPHKKQIAESICMTRSQHPNRCSFYIRTLQPKGSEQPSYSVFMGKRLVGCLVLTREYQQNILLIIERSIAKYPRAEHEKNEKPEDRDQQAFRASFEQENEAPSFTTYQLQERLNQEACQEYLQRMFQEKLLKKYEYLKLNEKCEENFVEFYRIFCEGAIDNDYDNFKNQILHKVDNNLEILLSNVDEMDLSRPISRQEQRKQNLKKSVSNIEIVKVENYFEILDQLKPLLNPKVVSEVKHELLNQNQVIFQGFSDYLSRKTSKQELAAYLEEAVKKNKNRPVSRCLNRSANRNRAHTYNSEDELYQIPNNDKAVPYRLELNKVESEFISEQPPTEAQKITLMVAGSGSKETSKNDNKEIPPRFGSSKEENNFSPIKYMTDIDSNCKQAQTRLANKSEMFEPEEYGLLYYYLQTRDDCISNHIQQLEWNQQGSINKLKRLLEAKVIELMQQNFTRAELDLLVLHRDAPQIDCIYQNFKYESDLTIFLSALHTELTLIAKRSPYSSPQHSPSRHASEKPQTLTKKASDSKLLDKVRKSMRKYSGESQQASSPKESSFSHAKTLDPSLAYIDILSNFWNEEFEEMIEHCSFTEERREEYLREAFKEGNPSVFSWINSFVQGRLGIIDTKELKGGLKIRDQENKYIMRLIPIFNEILRSFVEEGRLTDKMRKWCVVELMELNTSLIAAFECYIKIKNADEFVDSIIVAFELQNNEMEFYRKYLERIEQVLKQMSGHDELSMAIFKMYPKQVRAICELYFLTGDIDQLLDSLDVLHRVEAARRTIKVATLNFSGINLNPFEYHDGTHQMQVISGYMGEILQTEKKLLDCNLKVIDKCYTNNRMSVRFGTTMAEQEKLIGLQKFAQKWREFFDREKPSDIGPVTEETIEATILFDYYCYLAIIRALYGTSWVVSDQKPEGFTHLNKYYSIPQIEELSSRQLRQFLEKKQNGPASKTQVKYQLAIEFMMRNELDIFFVQEAGGQDWGEELIHDYAWVKGGKDSIIIFRKDKFGAPRQDLAQQYQNVLNFNNDTVFYFGDRGYLLLSVHLKSGSINVEQAKQMFETLEKIYDEHPMLKIIIGTDANHFIGGSQANFLNFAPKTADQVTSHKMRTCLQVQFKKANEEGKDGKDYILTNLNIREYSVQKISGRPAAAQDLIPSDEHPYDHFVVTALL